MVQVVVLLAIVCAVFMVTLATCAGTIRIPSKKEACQANLRQFGVYLSAYVSKYHAYPPFGQGPQSWFGMVWGPGMAADANLFRCPCRKSGYGPHYWTVVRPGSWSGAGGKFGFATADDLGKAPADLPIACDQLLAPPNHPDGSVSVLFRDGSVRLMKAADFTGMSPAFLGPPGWAAPAGTK